MERQTIPSLTDTFPCVWMTEWVRLREARKREVALKDQAVDARIRQRAEADRLAREKHQREYEDTHRPYLLRIRTLVELQQEAENTDPRYTSPGERKAWEVRANTALTEIVGESHPLLDDLDELCDRPVTASQYENYQYWQVAEGVMNAAVASYHFMNTKIQDSTIASTLDPDLIARVDHVFRVEDWTAVASLAATFVEDRFRVWAGLDQSSFGVNLMTKVLHPDTGVFPLGTVTGEQEGWHQLGRGFVGACSNVDRHRIQSRDDLRRYAVGVLGTASLLLTQMRHQHGNRFVAQ